ncbi:hypothetical protein G4O51_00210 [Candidatus Bathyarchaeota archaeon A05DMB-2]|nr:hypothetical protein [Candidatus Bathyarchaeota archaeon A05DMB-2]
MSEKSEVEKLRDRHAELEAESRSLKEKQKALEDSILILEEKLAIEELRASNNSLKDTILQLEAKKNELEAKLNQKWQTSEPPPQPGQEAAGSETEVPQPPEEAALEPAEEVSEEFEGDTVTVTAIDDGSLEEQEAIGEELKRQQEKKRHRFF